MTDPLGLEVLETDLNALSLAQGRVVIFAEPGLPVDASGRRINRLTKGGLDRLLASEGFSDLKPGEAADLAWPAGMVAEAVQVIRLPKRPDMAASRRAGAAIGKALGKAGAVICMGSRRDADHILLGMQLRAYAFQAHKTADPKVIGPVRVMSNQVAYVTSVLPDLDALAQGVHFTRDLVNEPANVLTTTEFANRLVELKKSGLKVTVLGEAELEKLGMRTLLAVGQGSDSPTKVVVMEWQGGKKGDAPFALIGKGVVFDTGGISLKPAAGMEDMTMDMGGAGTVAGVMKALALRKAKANVVGLVGLVENMPDGKATRPGDVIRSMKGDTVEIINTDAEGRMVLADVLWYAADKFKPAGMIDLATLTGAIIVGLGHEMAGVFSNDEDLSKSFLKAAAAEGEGAWRMPLAPAYDKLLKSNVADMMNVGGRAAGSVTAAQFLQRFVPEGMPWIHLDIAGVASVKTGTDFAPKGATGWGVLALNRLIADRFEEKPAAAPKPAPKA